MIDFKNVEKYRENNRIEAKKALGGLPHSIWETYSAFANSFGGVIFYRNLFRKGISGHYVLEIFKKVCGRFRRSGSKDKFVCSSVIGDGSFCIGGYAKA